MHRDLHKFPNDESGDILWSMRMAGDSLVEARPVNFSVLFEAERYATSYASEMLKAGFEVQVDECIEVYDTSAWEAVASIHLSPTHERIAALSDLIDSIATSHGGFPNGWAAELSPNNSFKPTPLRGSA